MAENLLTTILVIVSSMLCVGLMVLAEWNRRNLERHIRLLNRHLDRLVRMAFETTEAYHRVRHGDDAADRLSLDWAMSQLARLAESARKREEIE